MSCPTSAEDASAYYNEKKPPPGCCPRPIDELAGAWVNVDSPFEHYTVEGHRVTRTDLRGIHHFTLHWDDEQQRWQWGTKGRLSLEWHDDDVISWVPDVHAQHTKVWHWRRSGPRPAHHAMASQHGFGPPVVPSMPNYGPGRRGRSSHNWSQPYPNPSSSWSMSSVVVPARNPRSGGAPRSQWGYDCGDDGQPYLRHCHHDGRYRREHRHQHGYHGWRSRGAGYSDFYRAASITLPCGLTTGEVSDLLSRDITPEDYDLLLRLDKEVPKPTASADCIDGLPAVPKEDFMGNNCSVCLSKFEADDAVVALPCQHHFHRNCVTKWLGECRRMCPLCGAEVLAPEEASSCTS